MPTTKKRFDPIVFDMIVLSITKVCAYFNETLISNMLTANGQYRENLLCISEHVWEALEKEMEFLNEAGVKVFTGQKIKRLHGFEIDNPQLLSILRTHFFSPVEKSKVGAQFIDSRHKFRLLKDWSEYKKGQEFYCQDGLVRGISNEAGEQINFDNKEYFEYIKNI